MNLDSLPSVVLLSRAPERTALSPCVSFFGMFHFEVGGVRIEPVAVIDDEVGLLTFVALSDILSLSGLPPVHAHGWRLAGTAGNELDTAAILEWLFEHMFEITSRSDAWYDKLVSDARARPPRREYLA